MKYLILVAFVFLAHPLLAHALDEDNDFQFWSYNSISKRLNHRTTLSVDGEMRFGDGASTLFLYYVQARLKFCLRPPFAIEPGYRQLYFITAFNRKWQALYEPFVDIWVIKEWRGWHFSSRNRPSYIFFERQRNVWQYRSREMLKSPWKWGKIQLNPLIFDEVFFREYTGFEQNRFGIGGQFTLWKNQQTTFVYMRRHRNYGDEWRSQNVLWLQLNFSL